jgi:DNA-binding response OmpR family regulator
MNVAIHHGDPNEMRRLAQLLEAAGVRCDCFATPEGVMHAAHHGDHDAAMIDIRDRRDLGEVLLAWIACRASAATALLLLAADRRPESEVHALDAGADDIVFAPARAEVLSARLRAILRRRRPSPRTAHSRLRLRGFLLDRDTGSVLDGERPIELTPREFALAWFLFSRPSTFVTREAITMAVWGVQADIAEHTLEQHISKLRKKMNLVRERGLWIRAAYGRGYRLDVQAAAARAPLASVVHSDALAMARQMETVFLHRSGTN